jgi:ATP-dependent Clp protease ATP-binding subunit ClpB
MKILDGEVLHGDHVRIDADKRSNTLHFEVVSRAGIPLEHGVAIGQA